MNMDEKRLKRDEGCRDCVLIYLFKIPALAQDVDTIHAFLSRQHDWTRDELRDALVYLAGDELVKVSRHPRGSTRYYQISTRGRRAVEQAD